MATGYAEQKDIQLEVPEVPRTSPGWFDRLRAAGIQPPTRTRQIPEDRQAAVKPHGPVARFFIRLWRRFSHN